MALKPLGDRIIVRFEETEEKTASGFVLAGASHETTKTAEVLAVAYVRFASVYREFKDVNTFMTELKKMLDTK